MKVETIISLLSEAAVEIQNLDRHNNVVRQRLRAALKEIDAELIDDDRDICCRCGIPAGPEVVIRAKDKICEECHNTELRRDIAAGHYSQH